MPAGGGAFALDRLTLGVFLNDQPGHRFAAGSDRANARPLTAREGWILPPGAAGLCTFDAALDVIMISVASELLAEVGLDRPENLRPVVGAFDPTVLQLALAAPGFAAGGALYRETMQRALAAQLAHSLTPRAPASPAIDDARLRRAVDFIEDNLHRDLSLTEMAEIAAMSPFHFSRRFKAATGESPLQFVISARIARAKIYLRTTALTVAEICHRVGYNDVSRFGRHFKRAVGATPAQFRNP